MPIKLRKLPALFILKKMLDYDPVTGCLSWRISQGTASAGRPAGTLNPFGYLRLKIGKSNYMAHRIIWKMVTDHDPQEEIDHVDGDRSNNSWDNLREATKSQNQCNRLPCSKRGLPKGVRAVRGGMRYRSVIFENGKDKHLGYFATIDEASSAYAVAERRVHGAFSLTRSRI